MLESFKTNVIGVTHLFNLCIPLVLRGRVKKVIALSTGLADAEVTAKFDLWEGISYAASKAALNVVIAKFSAQYRQDGVLFMAVAPGNIDTGGAQNGKIHRNALQLLWNGRLTT